MSAHPPGLSPVARGTPPALTLVRPRGCSGVFGIEAAELRWVEASRPGLRVAAVTEDRAAGRFLGYIGFETMCSTGLHQHLDTAYSYFLDGGLWDYQGGAVRGDMGVNLRGATHDAVAYAKTLAAARLEGPVLYGGPGAVAGAPALHAGATVAPIVNDAPETMPDINIAVDALPMRPTSVPRIGRRAIFDGRQGGRDNRALQLQLLPGARTPAFAATGALELFVIGGALDLAPLADAGATVRIGPGGFAVVEPDARLSLGSEFGALAIVWADGAAAWLDAAQPDLFGFAAA